MTEEANAACVVRGSRGIEGEYMMDRAYLGFGLTIPWCERVVMDEGIGTRGD
jgi:hypothetical protein